MSEMRIEGPKKTTLVSSISNTQKKYLEGLLSASLLGVRMTNFRKDLEIQLEKDKKRFSECFGETYDFSASAYIGMLQAWIRNYDDHNIMFEEIPLEDRLVGQAPFVDPLTGEFLALDPGDDQAFVGPFVGEDDGL